MKSNHFEWILPTDWFIPLFFLPTRPKRWATRRSIDVPVEKSYSLRVYSIHGISLIIYLCIIINIYINKVQLLIIIVNNHIYTYINYYLKNKRKTMQYILYPHLTDEHKQARIFFEEEERLLVIFL